MKTLLIETWKREDWYCKVYQVPTKGLVASLNHESRKFDFDDGVPVAVEVHPTLRSLTMVNTGWKCVYRKPQTISKESGFDGAAADKTKTFVAAFANLNYYGEKVTENGETFESEGQENWIIDELIILARHVLNRPLTDEEQKHVEFWTKTGELDEFIKGGTQADSGT